MKISVYLHRNLVDLLRRFGDNLDDVVNRMLVEMHERGDPIEDLPKPPSRDGCSRIEIDVTDKTFLELVDVYGPTSPRLSLRRVIYWFLDNEKYIEYGWCYRYTGKDKYCKLKYTFNEFETEFRRCFGEEILQEMNEIFGKIDTMIGELKDDNRKICGEYP